MTKTLEEYTLATLRTALKTEFGLTDTKLDTYLTRILNDAQQWVIRRRKAWHWLLVPLVIDVEPVRSGTANFSQGSKLVTAVSGTLNKRDILLPGATAGPLSDGYLVTQITPQYLLDANYLGSTVTAQGWMATVGYYALPSDFSKLYSLRETGTVDKDRLRKVDVYELEKYRAEIVSFQTTYVYAIVPDPLQETEQFYLTLYPWPDERKTLRGMYWRDAKNLNDDTDVPIIPRNDRLTLFYIACYLYALRRNDDRATAYLQMAEVQLENALEDSEFTDDPEQSYEVDTEFPFLPLPEQPVNY